MTRWYRAPELLVQNRQYDAKVDMWSVGCILAELLGVRAIFPGKDSLHQLRLIVELLGTPTNDELRNIENEQAVAYVRAQAAAKGLGAKEAAAAPGPAAATQRFERMYPDAEPKLLELLAQLLQFDPRKRPSAEEALAHPYLAAYRDAPDEGLPVPEIEMSFERENASKEELRNLIYEEVCHFHPYLRS